MVLPRYFFPIYWRTSLGSNTFVYLLDQTLIIQVKNDWKGVKSDHNCCKWFWNLEETRPRYVLHVILNWWYIMYFCLEVIYLNQSPLVFFNAPYFNFIASVGANYWLLRWQWVKEVKYQFARRIGSRLKAHLVWRVITSCCEMHFRNGVPLFDHRFKNYKTRRNSGQSA